MTAPQSSNVWDLPELPGLITVNEAAQLFGVTKESIFYAIYEQKKFKNVYRIGKKGRVARPLVVMQEEEVRAVLQRQQEGSPPSFEKLLTAWNRRVKSWGAEVGWSKGPIHPAGRPPQELIADYLAAHPQDPRPVQGA